MKSARAENAQSESKTAMKRRRMTAVPRLRRVRRMAHCGTHTLRRCMERCVGRLTEGMGGQTDPGVESGERGQDPAGDQHRDVSDPEIRQRTEGRAGQK